MDAQAKTDNEVQVETIKRGADDCLIKPKALCESLSEHIQYVVQRKKAIEALRHGYEYFRSIVEDAPCAIICISPQGRIVEFNACARDLWKQGRDEVTGKSFLKTCISRSERFNVYVVLRKALAGQSVKRTITTIIRSDDRCDSLLWDFSPIRTDGESISGVIAIARESSDAMVKIDNRLPVIRLTFKAEFNNAVEAIMNSLAAILEKIEDINNRADPDTLRQLADNMRSVNCEHQQIPSRKAAVMERLVLSLITAKADEVSK